MLRCLVTNVWSGIGCWVLTVEWVAKDQTGQSTWLLEVWCAPTSDTNGAADSAVRFWSMPKNERGGIDQVKFQPSRPFIPFCSFTLANGSVESCMTKWPGGWLICVSTLPPCKFRAPKREPPLWRPRLWTGCGRRTDSPMEPPMARPSDFNAASGRQHWWLRCLRQDKLRHLSVGALLGST